MAHRLNISVQRLVGAGSVYNFELTMEMCNEICVENHRIFLFLYYYDNVYRKCVRAKSAIDLGKQ